MTVFMIVQLGLHVSDFTDINKPNAIITVAGTLYVQNQKKT